MTSDLILNKIINYKDKLKDNRKLAIRNKYPMVNVDKLNLEFFFIGLADKEARKKATFIQKLRDFFTISLGKETPWHEEASRIYKNYENEGLVNVYNRLNRPTIKEEF